MTFHVVIKIIYWASLPLSLSLYTPLKTKVKRFLEMVLFLTPDVWDESFLLFNARKCCDEEKTSHHHPPPLCLCPSHLFPDPGNYTTLLLVWTSQ